MVAEYKPLIQSYGTRNPVALHPIQSASTTMHSGKHAVTLLSKLFKGGKRHKVRNTKKMRIKKMRKSRTKKMRKSRTKKMRKVYRGGFNLGKTFSSLTSKATASSDHLEAKGTKFGQGFKSNVKGFNTQLTKTTGMGVAKNASPITGAPGTKVPAARMPSGPPGSLYSPSSNVNNQIGLASRTSDLHNLTSQYHHSQ